MLGKLYADREYISKALQEILFVKDIHLVTKLRNNMNGGGISLQDKITLRKRAVIESVNDELKNICQIEYTGHRCFTNFITNLIAGLLAYSFLPKNHLLTLILFISYYLYSVRTNFRTEYFDK